MKSFLIRHLGTIKLLLDTISVNSSLFAVININNLVLKENDKGSSGSKEILQEKQIQNFNIYDLLSNWFWWRSKIHNHSNISIITRFAVIYKLVSAKTPLCLLLSLQVVDCSTIRVKH